MENMFIHPLFRHATGNGYSIRSLYARCNCGPRLAVRFSRRKFDFNGWFKTRTISHRNRYKIKQLTAGCTYV